MALFDRSLLKRLAFKTFHLPLAGPFLCQLGLGFKYGRGVITKRKAVNYLLANREAARKLTSVRSLPYILNLDTTNTCNLACPFCPTGTRQLRRARSRLELEQAKRVVDAVKDFAIEARFYNWGEPFLNPDIFEVVRHASEAGIYTVISSNLSVKTNDLAKRVLDSGLDHLRVSLDGLEQATLEQYRRHAKFELVLENIRAIVEEKRKRGSKKPELHLVMLVFRHNEREVGQLGRMAQEWGADSFTATPAFIYDESFVPVNPDYAPIQTVFKDVCQYLYAELMVEADGHISPCCTNTDARFDVGTLDDLGDVRAFWNGPAFQRLRAVSAGKRSSDTKDVLCHYCRFVGGSEVKAGRLSPLPPSVIANGEKPVDHAPCAVDG